jgi:hypothetical protein
VGYSSSRKEYKCFNIILNKLVESINVTIDDTCGQKIKEENKDSLEYVSKEEVKEEEREEEDK